jgi:hypothetical protein
MAAPPNHGKLSSRRPTLPTLGESPAGARWRMEVKGA